MRRPPHDELGMSALFSIFIQLRKRNRWRRTSHLRQGTKSLLSSPLRGSKSREAGSRSREASDSFVARSTRSTSVLLAGNA